MRASYGLGGSLIHRSDEIIPAPSATNILTVLRFHGPQIPERQQRSSELVDKQVMV